jgi:hypothetical protein
VTVYPEVFVPGNVAVQEAEAGTGVVPVGLTFAVQSAMAVPFGA